METEKKIERSISREQSYYDVIGAPYMQSILFFCALFNTVSFWPTNYCDLPSTPSLENVA